MKNSIVMLLDGVTVAANPMSIMFRPRARVLAPTQQPLALNPHQPPLEKNPGMVLQEIIVPLHPPKVAGTRVESHIQRKSR